MDGTPLVYAGVVILAFPVLFIMFRAFGPLGLGVFGIGVLGTGLVLESIDGGTDTEASVERISCPSCGARNDATDDDCHHCAADL